MKALLELLAQRGTLLDARCAERLRDGGLDLHTVEAAVRSASVLPLFLTETELARLVHAGQASGAAAPIAAPAPAALAAPARSFAVETVTRSAAAAPGRTPAVLAQTPVAPSGAPSPTRAGHVAPAATGVSRTRLDQAPAPVAPRPEAVVPSAVAGRLGAAMPSPPVAPSDARTASPAAVQPPRPLAPPRAAPPTAPPLDPGGAAVAASPVLVVPSRAPGGASLLVPSEPFATFVPPRRVAPTPAPAVASTYAHDWRILADVTGQSTCEGELTDFTRYFNDRLAKIKKMLRQRREMVGFVPIRQFRPGAMAEVKIVGIVNEVRTTKNGHRLLEIEDESGVCAVLAPASDSSAITEAETIVEDEVIGIVAKPASKGELLILQKVVRPEVPMERTPARSTHASAVAFVSDLHFGSKTFLHEAWDRFVRWINGEHPDPRSRALAAKVRYLVVNGDVVDGVGIFPGQEDELEILDAYDQYRAAGEQIARIRSDVKVFALPGNHDLVRPAEPQPTFPQKYTRLFPERTTFVGNPCRFTLEGVEILAYHGRSFDDWITRVPGLSYERPIDAMREMVARRHMAPIYGQRTPVAPEHKDYMVIESVPDIFETGHVHAAGMETWRGITLINSSCWQSQTAYQKMHGFQPQPGIVPVVELDTGKGWMLDFHEGSAGIDRVGRSRFQPEKGVTPEL